MKINFKIPLTFFVIILLQTQLFAMSSTKSINYEIMNQNTENEDRLFDLISFNEDGSELMFNEGFDYSLIDKSINKKRIEYRIFRLNLKNNTLQRYEFPDSDKFIYFKATFSPKGNFITFLRMPKIDAKIEDSLSNEEYNNLIRENSLKMEVGIMNKDGSNATIIKTEEGFKARPFMSNDETKIAYFLGKIRKPKSKTYAANFDIYEIDLKKQTYQLFAGPYEFFQHGDNSQYLEGDNEILTGANSPKGINNRDYQHSSIYQIRRNHNGILRPLNFEGIEHLENPFLSKDSNLFFYGQEIKTGLRLIKKDKNNKFKMWKPPHNFIGISQIYFNTINDRVFFIYSINKTITEKYHQIAFLDIKNNNWQNLTIPLAKTSKPINVPNVKEVKYNYNFKNNIDLRLPNFSLTNPLKLN
jgi:hypothetical protein